MMILSMSRSSWSESRISSSCSSPVGGTPAEQRVGDRARLLVDLLAHEPVVAVLLGGRQVPVDVVAPALRGRPSKSVTSTPSRVIVTTWSWPSSSASRVCSMNAATSEPRKFSPSPSPTTSGELRRAATTRVGSWASTATSVNAPSSRWQTRCIAIGQVDVRLRAAAPAAGRRPRCRSRRPGRAARVGLELGPQLGEVLDDPVVHQRDPAAEPRCGWALTSFGAPWVAQRVCPMPVVDGGQRVVGDRLLEVGELAGLLRDRLPAHRPRRRSRRSRSRGTPAAAARRSRRPGPALAPTYPTIPHMGRESIDAGRRRLRRRGD